jgi:PHP family Zn ribbon phosphoesterase
MASHDGKKFLYTIEFFPEEGKYHYDGHRLCNVLSSPAESRTHHNICPVCHKPLTVGVMHRVEELADRPEGFRPPNAIPYRRLIPLEEVIAQVTKRQVGTVAVENEYMKLVQAFGSELNVLMDTPVPYLEKVTTPELAKAISLVRQEQVSIIPGFDGIYGKIEIAWKTIPEPVEEAVQIRLF